MKRFTLPLGTSNGGTIWIKVTKTKFAVIEAELKRQGWDVREDGQVFDADGEPSMLFELDRHQRLFGVRMLPPIGVPAWE